MNKKSLLIMLVAGVTFFTVGWKFNLIKDYQKERVTSIIAMIWSSEENSMALSSQYHTKQSIIAIGSGKLNWWWFAIAAVILFGGFAATRKRRK